MSDRYATAHHEERPEYAHTRVDDAIDKARCRIRDAREEDSLERYIR